MTPHPPLVPFCHPGMLRTILGSLEHHKPPDADTAIPRQRPSIAAWNAIADKQSPSFLDQATHIWWMGPLFVALGGRHAHDRRRDVRISGDGQEALRLTSPHPLVE